MQPSGFVPPPEDDVPPSPTAVHLVELRSPRSPRSPRHHCHCHCHCHYQQPQSQLHPPQMLPPPSALHPTLDTFVSLNHDTYPFIDPATADLSGKSVLITGASRGIGLTTAAHFATAGCAKIALAARSPLAEAEAVVKKAAEAAGHPEPQVLLLEVDVTDADSVLAAAEQIGEAFGGSLDVLINNAGYLPKWDKIGDSDPDEWWKTWEVNIKGTYLPCQFLLPLLLNSELKTVINITSAGGHRVAPSASAYQTTKFAICRFTEFLHVENAEHGLRVYALHPGGVKTELAMAMPDWMYHVLIDTPELPADVMVWLCRERRGWLSGRYVSATWNMEELAARQDEIVAKDLLKFRCALA